MSDKTARWLALIGVMAFAPSLQAEETSKPKFGPMAVPVTVDNGHLRMSAAPDYWAMASFYVPQQTSSACSLASLAMLTNALRGLPGGSQDNLVTQDGLLEAVDSRKWREQTKEDGDGVLFADLVAQTDASLKAFDIKAAVSAAHVGPDTSATLDAFRKALTENEKSANDMIVVYFNQGVVTGDWDGPHVSPIGAYDATHDRVLVMDIDREWYVPYWTATETLFKAMQRPAPADQGVLAGETGGWVHVSKG
ncbi:phytochelatin synthase family protein [Sinorhizobium sp. A49]|uniref:phytochelatin synthase family protein n=1 Tax=Sinorhizobium sp. A49 TaxID=1945861 RepID=UPI001115929E|nr:phytochelatin synthase family protein [Sinorhizobium sp. A49]